MRSAPVSNINPEKIEISFLNESKKQRAKISHINHIVESDSTNANNELTEKAKYLSEKTNKVQEETQAKLGLKFHNSNNALKNKKINVFTNDFNAYAALIENESKKQQHLNLGTPDESTTNDNLTGVKSDLITHLNTREYKYYGYYNRIKTQLNQWWVPKVQQKFTKMIRQGRTIASDSNKITKLVIILNGVGNLVNVKVLAESGIKDLDDAALEAFRSAAPFPNPPKGMVESDGTVKIRWDCVVES